MAELPTGSGVNAQPGSPEKPRGKGKPGSPEAPSRRNPIFFRLMLVVGALCVSATSGEIALRLFFSARFFIYQDEKTLLYRYDPTLGWFPIPGARQRFLASRVFSVANNSQGFRAPEFVSSTKPGIAFLGDSFVWGYDVEAEERFSD